VDYWGEDRQHSTPGYLKGQIFLGDMAFIDNARKVFDQAVREIPRSQRHADRPSLQGFHAKSLSPVVTPHTRTLGGQKLIVQDLTPPSSGSPSPA